MTPARSAPRIALRANAKLNLTLGIRGLRPDGFHELESVMQSVDLCDRVELRLASEPGVRLRCSEKALETPENLAARAAALFFTQAGLAAGAEIALAKNIPAAAGLAGGSADAAAVLAGLNLLCGAPFAPEKLAELGALLGADVPFCLRGGTLLARGKGERLEAAPALPPCRVLLCRRGEKSSTGALYKSYDESPAPAQPDTAALLAALRAGALPEIAPLCGNAFAPLVPQSARLREELLAAGALGACLSGSGPTVFGLFAQTAPVEIPAALSDAAPLWCRPARRGVEFE